MKTLLTIDEGRSMVKLARSSVESVLKENYVLPINKIKISGVLKELRGVFTSIYKYGNMVDKVKELRGCIGYPLPIKPLYKAVIETAKEAAFNDPRFPPVKLEELDNLIFEVSVLTPPEKIKFKSPLELPNLIEIGKDGLILRYGLYSGLLLPQVPVEYDWDAEEYLSHLSMKAGLPPDAYFYKGVEIYKFEAQIFSETSPNGEVVEIELRRE